MTTQTATPAPRTFATPAIDLLENEAEVLLMADLPGVQKDDVKLRFEEEDLVLHATHEGGKHVFRRTVRIPQKVQPDRIEAELSRGVLTVHLPKAEEARARQIPIR